MISRNDSVLRRVPRHKVCEVHMNLLHPHTTSFHSLEQVVEQSLAITGGIQESLYNS